METLTNTPGLFQKCKNKLRKRTKNLIITPKTLMCILQYAMEIVELTILKGSEQKNMAIKLVRSIVIACPLDESNKNLCLRMLDEGIIENTIELIVAATKGEIAVNPVIDVAKSCCGFFSSK